MPRAEPLQLRGIPVKPRLPIACTSNYNYYYPAHAQRMRRSVTDIYIYIPIARAYCAIMSLALRRSAIIILRMRSACAEA